MVPGILAPGEAMGEKVNLAPYFTGALLSSNRNNKPTSVNFLDGGGAAPLMKNMPAEDKTSNQYFLLTHLYEFFGALLGCTQQGMTGFDAYSGDGSMYDVHKFMDLSYADVTYFITQVALAAGSFGVAKDDITAVGEALGGLFNVRCGPATAVIPSQGKLLQSICIDKSCPEAKGGDCSKYDAAVEPSKAAMTTPMSSPTSTMGGGGGGSGGSSSTGTAPTTMPTGGTSGATTNGLSLAALIAGLAAFAL